jgi:hypothetical protein
MTGSSEGSYPPLGPAVLPSPHAAASPSQSFTATFVADPTLIVFGLLTRS